MTITSHHYIRIDQRNDSLDRFIPILLLHSSTATSAKHFSLSARAISLHNSNRIHPPPRNLASLTEEAYLPATKPARHKRDGKPVRWEESRSARPTARAWWSRPASSPRRWGWAAWVLLSAPVPARTTPGRRGCRRGSANNRLTRERTRLLGGGLFKLENLAPCGTLRVSISNHVQPRAREANGSTWRKYRLGKNIPAAAPGRAPRRRWINFNKLADVRRTSSDTSILFVIVKGVKAAIMK